MNRTSSSGNCYLENGSLAVDRSRGLSTLADSDWTVRGAVTTRMLG